MREAPVGRKHAHRLCLSGTVSPDISHTENDMKLRRKSASDDFKGFLDHGTSLTGELQFSGTLRVDGEIHGSITTNDLLIVGEQATVHADIRAGEIQIFGSVFGNVESERRIEVYPTGHLKGDIRTPQLIIEEGGKFEGRSHGATAETKEETVATSVDEFAKRNAPDTA
jgi:cytoskeletal protein CcmA (bactofilin family)